MLLSRRAKQECAYVAARLSLVGVERDSDLIEAIVDYLWVLMPRQIDIYIPRLVYRTFTLREISRRIKHDYDMLVDLVATNQESKGNRDE